ncbi:MAG TPA: HEAT repeat domain-containing protein [Kofleriaceae bacterium]|nr:HEAT repeat domain-containing protein [Kofleriaceae bacterium]
MRWTWRRGGAAAALAAGTLALAPGAARGFDWIGKIEIAADGLDSDSAEDRLAAVRKLGQSEIQWSRPYLLKALRDPDVRVRSAAGRILARAKVVEAVPIVIPWLAEADKDGQQAAAEILGELGDASAVPALVRSLSDPDAQVRVRVVTALGHIGGEPVVVPLINRLEDDKAEVRQAAVEQLAASGDRRAVIPLVGLFDDASVEVRAAAISAVGRLGDRAALPALLRLLRDSNDVIRQEAVAALGNLEAHEATETLTALLGTGTEGLKRKVAFALGQIAGAASSGQAGRDATFALVEALGNGQMRAAATEALSAAGKAAVPALVAHLEGKLDGDPATAVIILRDLGDPRATPVLVAELDRGRLSRELVLEALGKIGDGRALVPVLGLLADKDPAVRLAAMKALEPLIGKGSRAADVLGDMLDDPDLEIRVLAAQYLGAMEAEVAVPRLVSLARSAPENRLRGAAIAALGEIGSPEATRTLLGILKDGPPALHMAASNALIYVHDAAAMKPLLELVDRSPASTRAAVVRTLGGVMRDRKDDGARKKLEGLVGGARLDVALAAIAALGSMGDARSAGVLMEVAKGGQLDRRKAALEALASLRGADRAVLRGLFEEHLKSTDDRVAAAAAWGMGKIAASDGRSRAGLWRATKRRGFATPINASAALALVADKEDASRVVELLHHRSRLVRTNAAVAAARLGVAAARGRLLAMLARDVSWVARVAAARALGRIGGAGVSEALKKAAKDDARQEVREAAEAAAGGKGAKAALPARTDWRDFYFVDPTTGDKPVAQEQYFVLASDGIVTALYTDARGMAVEERFPPGDHVIASALEEKEY